MRCGALLLFLLLTTTPGFCQTAEIGTAETSGPCSPAVTGNNNQFTVNCRGISGNQGAELLRILNKIAKDQLDPKLVMEKLDEIEKEVKKANSGVWSGYDFNGLRRVQSPGRSVTTAGTEIAVFPEMVQLYEAHDWNALLGKAEGQIKETPDWPTPYFFSGIACANLGRRALATKRLQHFLSGADGRVDYQKAIQIADQLLAKLRTSP
jgi:hypothetical protein